MRTGIYEQLKKNNVKLWLRKYTLKIAIAFCCWGQCMFYDFVEIDYYTNKYIMIFIDFLM
jgi:hypothetical protein